MPTLSFPVRIVFAALCCNLLPDSRAVPGIVREVREQLRRETDLDNLHPHRLRHAVERVHEFHNDWFENQTSLHRRSAGDKLALAEQITAEAYNESDLATIEGASN
ncbi:MAG TPA: hypothetical protein VHY79_20055 [Rhizomicrobium sp.]|jgi:hypothetical protein|nr:hypothetical protein [Rhizomicrobium sp.]